MTSFNEWLEQRDERIYKEMFDDPADVHKFTAHTGITGRYFVERMGKIILGMDGEALVNKMARSPNLPQSSMNELGNELIAHMQNSSPEKDIDVTAVRDVVRRAVPQAEMALDAVIRRFAQRVGRKVGGGGNILFTSKSANKELRANPGKLDMYKTGIPEREMEPAKMDKLKNYRSLGF
jgi:hypothetical protein